MRRRNIGIEPDDGAVGRQRFGKPSLAVVFDGLGEQLEGVVRHQVLS
jgi:hypothetical protein